MIYGQSSLVSAITKVVRSSKLYSQLTWKTGRRTEYQLFKREGGECLGGDKNGAEYQPYMNAAASPALEGGGVLEGTRNTRTSWSGPSARDRYPAAHAPQLPTTVAGPHPCPAGLRNDWRRAALRTAHMLGGYLDSDSDNSQANAIWTYTQLSSHLVQLLCLAARIHALNACPTVRGLMIPYIALVWNMVY